MLPCHVSPLLHQNKYDPMIGNNNYAPILGSIILYHCTHKFTQNSGGDDNASSIYSLENTGIKYVI